MELLRIYKRVAKDSRVGLLKPVFPWLTLLVLMISPGLIAAPGDIQFERPGADGSGPFPPAVFAHWVHRVNFRCDTCHDSLFKMEAGSTEITMASIARGEACGACHDGSRAFATTISNCTRCHVSPSP